MSDEIGRLHSLVNKRQKYFARLTATYKIGQKCLDAKNSGAVPDAVEMESFRFRHSRAIEDFNAYERIADDIFIVNSKVPKESQIDADTGIASYEELHFKILGMYNSLFPSVADSVDRSSPHETDIASAKLPKIDIPSFSGDMKDWPNFYALFQSLIHKNDKLNKVQKMTYLRSYLKGHALGLVENITISEENYDHAFATLVNRFQCKRMLGNAYLEKIFGFKTLSEESLVGFNSFLEVFGPNLGALKNVGIADLFDFTILNVALRSLPASTRKEFENSLPAQEIPTLNQLVEYIRRQAQTLELGPRKVKPPSRETRGAGGSRSAFLSSVSTNGTDEEVTNDKPTERPCALCLSPDHKIFRCPTFKKMEIRDRFNFVKAKPLCLRCLGFHFIKKCQSTTNCTHCQSASHHSMLHRSDNPSPTTSPSKSDAPCQDRTTRSPSKETLSCALSGVHQRSSVLLNTAIIGVADADGRIRPVRAIIDGGSQISLITEVCAQKLRLKRRFAHVDLSAVANTTIPGNKGVVICNIQPIHDSGIELTTDALILPQISCDQPSTPIDPKLRARFSHLKLADPSFDRRAPIDFLIGADLYMDIINDSHNVIKGQPGAISTIFGWVIGGPTPQPAEENPTMLLTCCEMLNNSLKRFWEVEDVPATRVADPADEASEKHFQDTHHRNPTGRYIVSLPFNNQPEILPDTRKHAMKRLINLENRLRRDPPAYSEYRKTMEEYIELGHMSLSTTPFQYVMPHHCVFKESSSTTKVRTVFDASFHATSSSRSLNDLMETGPKLQKEISHVISHLRFGPIVVCSDIRQMYRQVLLAPEQRHYQQICYRSKPEEEPKFYTLNTLTFGVKASAYLAQRVLLQLVEDEGSAYPLAAEAVKQWTFVDNICTSVSSVQEGLALQRELVDLLRCGGFELRKWTSNHQSILDTVPPEHREHTLVLRSEEDDHTLKVLGLQYDPGADCFAYSITCNAIVTTKRGILSEISRIYDPLGWLSPVALIAKHLIQETWLSGIGWDAELPPEIHEDWLTLSHQLPALSKVKLSRYIPVRLAGRLQLLTFCDASNKGMSAVCYLRTEIDQEIRVHLLAAKCKVAPLKTESIPRLELGAALLASKLAAALKPILADLSISASYFFTDSTVVLSWLKTPPHKLKTFVANRVVAILEETDPSQWYHVPSAQNPADCASRGMLPNDLVDLKLWWTGPTFLLEPLDSWPAVKISAPEVVPELRGEKTVVTVASTVRMNSIYMDIISRSSSFIRSYRTIAWIRRLVYNAHNRSNPRKTPLNGAELRAALDACIREVQQAYFGKDIPSIRDGLPCSKSLQRLTPFIDDAGILRVGGRMKNAKAPYSTRHPIILPFDSHFTELLIDHYHILTLHSGPRLVQSLIQRNFWISCLRKLVRLRIQRCLICHRTKAEPQDPLMADLPKERVQPSRPFLNVGVDFAGPIIYKENLRRRAVQTKGYLAIFVCMVTKATHLEFVSSLSTTAFLAVLDRFVARRGLPQKIFSDCGSNFRGSANHFDRICKMLRESHEPITNHLSSNGVEWIFNPPTAAHMGGLWEAGVKSAKHHILRVLQNMVPTFEEMLTLAARVEAVLNSRPLGAVTSSPDDDSDFLTPGHFLIGEPLLALPEPDLAERRITCLERYQLLQRSIQCLWKRWAKDYMATLIPRSKWTVPTSNLNVGEVVFLRNENTHPLSWPIGRVLEVYPGDGGVVRVAKVKTPNGTYVRPVHKMLRLPPLPQDELQPPSRQA